MVICKMSNTNKTASNYEDKCKKTSNRENKVEKPYKEEDKEDKAYEIPVTEEIFKTEMDNKSNTKELSKYSQTVDIHKTNKKETAGKDETDTVKGNAETVSEEGAKEEICKLLKQKMERKIMFGIKMRKLLWCHKYERILRRCPKKVASYCT